MKNSFTGLMKLSVEDTDAYEVAVFSGVLLTASSSSKLMAVATFFALRLLTIGLILFDHVRSVSSEASLTFRSFEIPSAFASRTRCDPVNTLHLHLQSKARRCHLGCLGSDDFLSQSLQNEPANFCRLPTFGPRGKFRGFPEQRIRVFFFFQLPRYGPWSSSLVEVSR